MIFTDRQEAGKQLAEALDRFRDGPSVVLALPRGGIIPGTEIAKALNFPLGLLLVRKIGHPAYPEYAIGAIAENEEPVYNQREAAVIDEAWLRQAEAEARKLIEQRREMYYAKDFKPPEVAGKTAIIVDDGIATGLTMESAVKAANSKGAKKVVVTVPVALQESTNELQAFADEIIVLDKPGNFLGAVGAHYHQFEQVNDEEVKTLLREVRDEARQATTTGKTPAKSR